MKKAVPLASAITCRTREGGSVQVVLLDDLNEPMVALILSPDQAVQLVEVIGGIVDSYFDEEDGVGPVIGNA